MTNWKDSLYEDEAALLGHSELTDLLIYRIAWNRKMALQFDRRLKELGHGLKDHPLTTKEAAWAEKQVADLVNSPKYAEDERSRAECRARGGCTWGPVQADKPGQPSVQCEHCRVWMTAYQLPLKTGRD